MKLFFQARVLLVAMLVFCVVQIYRYDLVQYLKPSWLSMHLQAIQVLVQAHYVVAVLVYVCVYSIALGLALPGSTLCMVMAGLLFGVPQGFCYAMIGALVGSLLACTMSRYVVGSWVQQRYATRLCAINKELDLYGGWYLVTLRLAGVIPLGITNILVGATRMKLTTFIIATAIGIAPYALLNTVAGNCTHIADDGMLTGQSMTIAASSVLLRVVMVPLVMKFFWVHKNS